MIAKGQPMASSRSGSEVFEAVIPKGVQAGQTFKVTCPDGQSVDVLVPVGFVQGDTIPVEYVPITRATPVVMGVPIVHDVHDLYALEEATRLRNDGQEQSWSLGWIMYGLGWCVCCVIGPFGPIFWLCAWVMHRLRPKAERERFPRERYVANLSCCTAVSALLVHMMFAMIVVWYVRHIPEECLPSYRNHECLQKLSPTLDLHDQVRMKCGAECGPALCYEGRVYGGRDGIYPLVTSVCGAALQAGAVKEGIGGEVVVRIEEGQPVYGGRSANGILSRSWESNSDLIQHDEFGNRIFLKPYTVNRSFSFVGSNATSEILAPSDPKRASSVKGQNDTSGNASPSQISSNATTHKNETPADSLPVEAGR